MQKHKKIICALGAVAMSALFASPVFGSTAAHSKFVGTPVKIGLETSLTGSNSAGKSDGAKAAQALVDATNAAGGVDHHQLQLIVADDQSSASGALVATQTLVSEGVVAIADPSSTFVGAPETYADGQGVIWAGQCVSPQTTGDPDVYCSTPSNGTGEPTTTVIPQFMKTQHVSVLDGVAPGAGLISAPAASTVKLTLAAAQNCCGIRTGVFAVDSTQTTTDFTTDALALKSSNAQAVYMSALPAPESAFAQAMKNQGVSMLILFNTSTVELPYLQASAFQGTYMTDWYRPWTSHDGSAQYFKNMKKYAPGVYGGYTEDAAYVQTDLLVSGLQGVKGTATGAKLGAAITKLSSWNADGLLPTTINFTVANRSRNSRNVQRCMWFGKVTNNKLVTLNGGKPLCGAPIANS